MQTSRLCLVVSLLSAHLFFISGLALTTKYRVVWFRPHALRSIDNEALWTAVNEHNDEHDDGIRSKLRFVFLWDRPVHEQGGTASDVFVINALQSLNETLQGGLEIIESNLLDYEGKSESKGITDIASHQADAILGYAQDLLASGEDTTTPGHRSSPSVEIFYLKTYERNLESALSKHLAVKGRQIQARNFGGSHTLIDYNHLEPTRLLKDAIEKHPFSSPLIPFVDFVMDQLKDKPLSDVWPSPKLTPLDLKDISQYHHQSKHKKFSNSQYISLDELGSTIGKTRNTTWGDNLSQRWAATEDDAARILNEFVHSQYPTLIQSREGSLQTRNTKGRTHLASYISPYLARGLLSPKQIYHAIQDMEQQSSIQQDPQQGGNSFLRRLAWRDYAYVVSMVFPDAILQETPIRSGYESMHGHDSKEEDISKQQRDCGLLAQWKCGMTGFPLVDAGMRQLITEGFMPQQVRLAVSACLVEGLNIQEGWRLGRQHFEEYLIDYDAMINTNMWQNAGGVGLDPYYVGLDYKKRPYWDADGSYVRTWCPELKDLPDRIEMLPTTPNTGGTNTVDCLYTPWKAPPEVLEAANVVLGDSYPQRICDEREGRRQFIQALRRCRSSWPLSKIDSGGKDIIEFDLSEPIGVFTPKSLMI